MACLDLCPSGRRVGLVLDNWTGVGFLKGQLVLIQDLNFVLFFFFILHSYALLTVTICVNITVSHSKGPTVFCNLKLHVLR